MITSALAALALGGLLFISLPGRFQTSETSEAQTVSPEFTERYQLSLPMGIRINTGLVVAGNIGSSTKMKYTIIGNEVNITGQTLNIAQPVEVLFLESTYRFVA